MDKERPCFRGEQGVAGIFPTSVGGSSIWKNWEGFLLSMTSGHRTGNTWILSLYAALQDPQEI